MKKTRHIAASSARFLAGEMSDSEKQLFLNQLKDDSTMQKEFNDMKETWNRFHTSPLEKYSRSAEAWNELKDRLSSDGLLEERPSPVRTPGWYGLRIAAVIAVLTIVGIGISRLMTSHNPVHDHVIAYTPSYATSGYTLPDGSRVFMNEGSGIVYPENFSRNRTVKLEGEAFFDISHDPSRPFSINADQTVITVLGTTFNVKENRKDGTVEVLVESGSVRVHGKQEVEGVTLTTGQLGKSDGKKTIVTTQQDVNYLSWKTREFRFVNTGLDQIIRTLENAYHENIDTGSVNLTGLKLTSTYKDQTFESVLRTICTAFDLSYVKTENGYRLTGR